MSKLYKTKNDLPEGTREEIIGILNARLADGLDLVMQSKQAHWNVKGPHFMQLHELFDSLYGQSGDWVDLMAERITQLGGTAEGTLQAVSGRTKLPAYPLDLSEGGAHVDALSSALAAFGKSVRAAIDAADKQDDKDTADLFTEISRGADKMLWFLEAHLQGER